MKSCPISRILVLLLLVLSGGSALARRDAVPVALQGEARIRLDDLAGPIRYRVDGPADQAALAKGFLESWKRERAYLTTQGYSGPLPPTAFLGNSACALGDDGREQPYDRFPEVVAHG